METNDYLRALRRHWRVILAATLIGGLAAAALSIATRQQAAAQYSATVSAVLLTPQARATVEEQLQQAEQYVATTSLLVPVDARGASRVPTFSRVLVSDLVMAQAARALDTTVDDVQARIGVTVPAGSEVIEISTMGADEFAARKLGTAVISALTSQMAALDSQAAAPVILGTTVTAPTLAADATPTQVQAETARLARALITSDPAAAQTAVTPVVALFDQSLAAELASDLSLGTNPADLFKTFVVTAVAGAPDPMSGAATSTGAITISVTANDAAGATALAQGAAALLQERAAAAAGEASTASPLVITEVSESAAIATTGNGNRTLTNVILGLLIGFAAGVGYAFLRASRDHTIRSPRQLFAITDAAPIGVVTTQPSDGTGRWAALSAGDASGDGYRSLRSNLLFGAPDLLVLTVTSPEAGDGKLTIAVNLAIALAQVGKSVVLIEADLRQPRLASALGLDSGRGLADVLADGTPISQALQTWAAGSIDVLAAGQPVSNPSELLSSPSYAAALAELRGTHDYVICLSGPILAGTEAAVAAKQSDGALVVVRLAKTTTTDLAAAATALIQVQSPVAGLIVTDVPASQAIAWAVMAGPAPAEV